MNHAIYERHRMPALVRILLFIRCAFEEKETDFLKQSCMHAKRSHLGLSFDLIDDDCHDAARNADIRLVRR